MPMPPAPSVRTMTNRSPMALPSPSRARTARGYPAPISARSPPVDPHRRRLVQPYTGCLRDALLFLLLFHGAPAAADPLRPLTLADPRPGRAAGLDLLGGVG